MVMRWAWRAARMREPMATGVFVGSTGRAFMLVLSYGNSGSLPVPEGHPADT
jgi:hypothetical protein